MTVYTEFQTGKHRIEMVMANFHLWFDGMSFTLPVKFGAYGTETTVAMTIQDLYLTLTSAVLTLGQLLYSLDYEVGFIPSPLSNIFYIKDKNGIIRAVSVLKVETENGLGYIIDAFPKDRTEKLVGGHQVFSKVLTITQRVEILEAQMSKLLLLP